MELLSGSAVRYKGRLYEVYETHFRPGSIKTGPSSREVDFRVLRRASDLFVRRRGTKEPVLVELEDGTRKSLSPPEIPVGAGLVYKGLPLQRLVKVVSMGATSVLLLVDKEDSKTTPEDAEVVSGDTELERVLGPEADSLFRDLYSDGGVPPSLKDPLVPVPPPPASKLHRRYRRPATATMRVEYEDKTDGWVAWYLDSAGAAIAWEHDSGAIYEQKLEEGESA